MPPTGGDLKVVVAVGECVAAELKNIGAFAGARPAGRFEVEQQAAVDAQVAVGAAERAGLRELGVAAQVASAEVAMVMCCGPVQGGDVFDVDLGADQGSLMR